MSNPAIFQSIINPSLSDAQNQQFNAVLEKLTTLLNDAIARLRIDLRRWSTWRQERFPDGDGHAGTGHSQHSGKQSVAKLSLNRNDLMDSVKQLQGYSYQIALRELETLAGHTARLHQWTQYAKEAAEKYA